MLACQHWLTAFILRSSAAAQRGLQLAPQASSKHAQVHAQVVQICHQLWYIPGTRHLIDHAYFYTCNRVFEACVQPAGQYPGKSGPLAYPMRQYHGALVESSWLTWLPL